MQAKNGITTVVNCEYSGKRECVEVTAWSDESVTISRNFYREHYTREQVDSLVAALTANRLKGGE